MMTHRLSRRRLVPWSFAVAAVIGSCNLRNPGTSLPPDELTYPNALALSPALAPDAGHEFLYVANTNFDLRYNSASVHSYNLASLDRELDQRHCLSVSYWPTSDGGTRYVVDNTHPAAGPLDGGLLDASADSGPSVADAGAPLDGGTPAADAGLIGLADDFETAELSNPQATVCGSVNEPDAGDCCFDTPEERNAIRQDEHPIDSYGVGIGVSPDGKRVYVPVSSRNQLTYLDVADGKLSCGTEQGMCRRGPRIDGIDEVPDDEFPGTLTAMAVGRLEDIIAQDVAPPSDAGVAPPSDAGTEPPSDASTATYIATTHEFGGFSLFVDRNGSVDPVLESVGHNLPQRPRAVVADASKHLLYVASANSAAISRLSVRVDPDDDLDSKGGTREPGPRELFYQSTQLVVSGVSQPLDTRDLTVDTRDSSRLYGMVRASQESVAFFKLDPNFRERGMRLIDAVRVGAGPSKIKFITIGAGTIDARSFLLVSCYDSKTIYIIDPDTRRLVSVVRSLAGPFEMAFDEHRKLLHVADFRASVLRVVDLAGLVDATKPPPRIVATIGLPHFKGVK